MIEEMNEIIIDQNVAFLNKALNEIEIILEKNNWQRTPKFDEEFSLIQFNIEKNLKLEEKILEKTGQPIIKSKEYKEVMKRIESIINKYFKKELN